ncbi:hypothetical protein BDF14DRAFT_806085 [Spinellus fusiger]|nr:hypothetical protein BDF14DRAFT_806085 [Spinellus fusiger]
MTTNMNFGPEWMRGSFPKRPTHLESQSMRSLSPSVSSTLSRTHSSTNITSLSLASHSQVSDTTSDANSPFDMLSSVSTPSEETDINPFKYSKDLMLSLYKPTDLPLDFEKHEYVAVEESQGPLSFVDLSENEKKLLAGPVHADMTRRINNGDKNERTDRSNVQRTHRDTYASPLHSPAVENTPTTPGKMNLARTKGTYFLLSNRVISRRADVTTITMAYSSPSI